MPAPQRNISALGQLKLGALFLVVVFILGTAGFHLVEEWSIFDAFYMCLITITTIGYGEVHRLSETGRLVNSFVILFGVGAFTYTAAQIMHVMVQQELGLFLKTRTMARSLEKMTDHFIVCGAGRLGIRIVRRLLDAKANFVVIEQSDVVIAQLAEVGVHIVKGDATKEETLHKAGIDRAQGLVTTIGNDPQNVYICLTARELRSDLCIVARANSIEAEDRLRRAGAIRVISPDRIGAQQMADALLRPAVIDFFDDIMKGHDAEIIMDGVTIQPGSTLEDQTLKEARLPDRVGVNVIRVKLANGTIKHQPSGDTVLHAGDHLLVVGDHEALRELKELCC